jgi:hypothetical protein
MALDAGRLAAIPQTDHPIAPIGGVLHSLIDALIREQSGHDQGVDADVAQHLIERGGAEGGGGTLRQHQFIGQGLEFWDHARGP